MSSVKTIAKNAGFLMVGDVIGKVLSFFLVVAISRYLGDVGLGKYSFIFAFIGLFTIFSDLGLQTILVRNVARNKQETEKYLDNILTIKVILGIATILLSAIIINFINKSVDVTISVYIIAIATFFLGLSEIFEGLFQAYEKMEYKSLIIVIERIVSAGGGILILFYGGQIIELCLVFLLSYLLIFLVGYFIIRKRLCKIRIAIDFSFWRYLLKHSLPFWFTTIFITIYFRIGSVMLSLMNGYQAAGWYSAPYKMLDALYFIPSAIIMSVFPAMSKFHLADKESLGKLYKKSFLYLFSIGLAMSVGTTLLADRIILFIYKEQFTNSVLPLQILIWAELMIFISSLSGYLLNSIDKQQLFTYTTAFCAVINAILNYTLILNYSYIGAAIATLATEIIVFIMLFYFVSKNKYGFSLGKVIIGPVIAGVVMAVAIHFLESLHLLILVPAAGIVYFACLFMMGAFTKEEIDLVKHIIKRT